MKQLSQSSVFVYEGVWKFVDEQSNVSVRSWLLPSPSASLSACNQAYSSHLSPLCSYSAVPLPDSASWLLYFPTFGLFVWLVLMVLWNSFCLWPYCGWEGRNKSSWNTESIWHNCIARLCQGFGHSKTVKHVKQRHRPQWPWRSCKSNRNCIHFIVQSKSNSY